MNRKLACTCIALWLFPAILAAPAGAQIADLEVGKIPSTNALELRWTETGERLYLVYRGEDPASLESPAAVFATPTTSPWIDANPPHVALLCYSIAGADCLVQADCDDGNECTDDTCNPLTLKCEYADNTLPCDDSDDCTLDDACSSGTCTGTPRDCGDGNDCTDDFCATGVGCQHVSVSNGSPCDDGNPCTTGEACFFSNCEGGAPVDCDDTNGCTADSCDPATGCVNDPLPQEGKPCEDGNDCTAGDTCASGLCAPGPPVLDGTPCEDGDRCTLGDSCATGACTPGTPDPCDDGEPCTTDSCDPVAGCLHGPLPDSTPCDDGNACTIAGSTTCTGGVCGGGTWVDCNDHEFCTIDVCDPDTGCGYSNRANGIPCDDGDPCTLSTETTCENGVCGGATPINCDDYNVCTIDECDEVLICKYTPTREGLPCDDRNKCTDPDTCRSGVCAGEDISATCDDENDCTQDICIPAIGCDHTFLPAGDPCNDGSYCTGPDLCNGSGLCDGPAIDCNDFDPCTLDSCQPLIGCVQTPIPDGDPCEDGDLCTAGETCTGHVCSGGGPRDCSDGDLCTDDSCDPATGCMWIQIPCSDGEECTVDGCDPVTGCTFIPVDDGTPCTDADECTVGDQCIAGACTPGDPRNCTDVDPCTVDTCDPATGCHNDPKDCSDLWSCTLDSCNPLSGDCEHTEDSSLCDDPASEICDPYGICSGSPPGTGCCMP